VSFSVKCFLSFEKDLKDKLTKRKEVICIVVSPNVKEKTLMKKLF
jgi:hypothetical protein